MRCRLHLLKILLCLFSFIVYGNLLVLGLLSRLHGLVQINAHSILVSFCFDVQIGRICHLWSLNRLRFIKLTSLEYRLCNIWLLFFDWRLKNFIFLHWREFAVFQGTQRSFFVLVHIKCVIYLGLFFLNCGVVWWLSMGRIRIVLSPFHWDISVDFDMPSYWLGLFLPICQFFEQFWRRIKSLETILEVWRWNHRFTALSQSV